MNETKNKYLFEESPVAKAVFNIPLLFILNAVIGMYGIVWTQLIADVMTVVLSLAVHRRYVRKYFLSLR